MLSEAKHTCTARKCRCLNTANETLRSAQSDNLGNALIIHETLLTLRGEWW